MEVLCSVKVHNVTSGIETSAIMQKWNSQLILRKTPSHWQYILKSSCQKRDLGRAELKLVQFLPEQPEHIVAYNALIKNMQFGSGLIYLAIPSDENVEFYVTAVSQRDKEFPELLITAFGNEIIQPLLMGPQPDMLLGIIVISKPDDSEAPSTG
jgi:hypothetical protein